MNTYTIYKMNKNTITLFNQYPNIKQKLLSLKPQNSFFTHQIEILFESNYGINEYMYAKLSERLDYQREYNIHTIYNQLTKEKIICKVNDFTIEIVAHQKTNIFFDILYQKSKRYVIIDEQCKNQEV